MTRSGTADTEIETLDERQWEDLRSPGYKGALLEHFEITEMSAARTRVSTGS